MQTVRYGMTEDKPKSGKRMAELGKTLTVYLTLFIVVVVLLCGILAYRHHRVLSLDVHYLQAPTRKKERDNILNE